ncbi:MAG: hypothetical protein AMXMBFR59_06930 [Rhodanobacteraceae bacterium]
MTEPQEIANTAPRGYIVNLPAVHDSATGETLRATFELFLYGPQAEEIGVRPVMNAAGFFVDENGIELYLVTGRVYEHPEHWSEAFHALGLSGELDGLPALAALKAVSLWIAQRPRKRGERGPGKTNQQARDFLLSAALVRMANGMGMRAAVCEAISEYEDYGLVPWRFETAEETLLKIVKRHLGAVRFFVPRRPGPVR